MKKLFMVFMLYILTVGIARADALVWDIPGGIGSFQLPTSFTDLMPTIGQDFVKQKTIGAISTPVLTLFGEVKGYVGAAGAYHFNEPVTGRYIEPYLALGADIKKYVPVLNQFEALHIHGFGRYDTTEGGPKIISHLGAGVAVAYKFGGASETSN